MKFKFYKNPVRSGAGSFAEFSDGLNYHQTGAPWAVYELPPGFSVQMSIGPQRGESLRLKMGVLVSGQVYNQKTDPHGLMAYLWDNQLDLDIIEHLVPVANTYKGKINVYAMYTPKQYHGYMPGFRIHDIRVGEMFFNMKDLVAGLPPHMRPGCEVFPSLYSAESFFKGNSNYRTFPKFSSYGEHLTSQMPVAKVRMRPWSAEYQSSSKERCIFERLPLFGVTDIRKVIRYWRQLWSPEVVNALIGKHNLDAEWDKDDQGNQVPWESGKHPHHSALCAVASRVFILNVRQAKAAFIEKFGEAAYTNLKLVDSRFHNMYPMHKISQFLLQDYPEDLTKNYPTSIYPLDDTVVKTEVKSLPAATVH